MYEKGQRAQDPDVIRQIGEACVKGRELPLRFITKLPVFVSMMEMTAATGFPLASFYSARQAVQCFAMVLTRTHSCGMICATKMRQCHDFMGATAGSLRSL